MNKHLNGQKVIRNLLVIYFIHQTNAFSYNTNSKIVYTPKIKSSEQSYFGYTALLRDGKDPVIIVGAPRDNSSYAVHKNITNPGAIYSCPINFNENNSECSQKLIDAKGNDRINRANGLAYHHKKDEMLLGMSIAGTANNNGSLIMCAPRWINQIFRDFDSYSANGICYVLKDTESNETTVARNLLPLSNKDHQNFKLSETIDSDDPYYFRYGQAGISTEISDDNTEFLIGAPGVYIWTGSIIKYKIKYNDDGIPRYERDDIPNPYYTKELKDASYLGYSVGFGKFISNQNEIYVAGAPRGSDYKGEVYVFSFPDKQIAGLDIKAKLEGKKIGEYFGSTIGTIDINQDGLTDLIIGAPLYAELSGWEIGKVYVYINQDNGIFKEQDASIYGSYRDGARFGMSISDIGDINGDGFIDVAIGAPYENHNSGAVYIYLGSANGLNPVYVQRITMDEMKGFGISISKGVDIDKNFYKDIAIGAYDSGHVVLLRSHPTVGIIPRIETIPTELLLNDTEFAAKICIKFQGYSQHSTELDVNVYIDNEYKRVIFDNKSDEFFSIAGNGGDESCRDILINIQTKDIDYSRPIEVKISYKLKHNPMDDHTFCASCSVLRPSTSQDFSIHVPIAAGCGDDLICRPDLKLKVDLLNKLPYIVGSSPSLKFNITLKNIGEPAFLTQLQIIIPFKISPSRVPINCNYDESIMLCDIDNPFISTKSFMLEFSTTSLLNSDEMLTFNITALSGGVEETPNDNNIIYYVKLKSIARLDIISKVAPRQYNYMYTEKKTIKETSLSHSFEILNLGPSPVNMVMLHFFIPVSFYDKIADTHYNIANVYEPKAIINNQFMMCNLIRGSYAKNKNEFQSTDLFENENSTDSVYTTTDKSIIVDNYILKSDNNLDGYIPRLPWSNDDNIPAGSLNINCTDEERVSCLVVECTGTLNRIDADAAQIFFDFDIDTTTMRLLLNDNNFIIVSSYAMARPVFNSSERSFNWASSYLIGSEPPAKVPIWLIVLGVILGILSLAVTVFILHKFGFFQRKKKEQLELLKNEEVKEDELNILEN